MKKLFILLIAIAASIAVKAQSNITASSGIITINGTAHGVTDVAYIADPAGRLFLCNKYNYNDVYLRAELATGIINGSTGVNFGSISEATAYLSSQGVGSQPAGSSGGGSGGSTDVSGLNKEPTQIIIKTRQDTIISRLIQQQNIQAAQLAQLKSSIAVTGTFWPTSQTVNGSVNIGNLPATQPVSGTVTTTKALSVKLISSVVVGTTSVQLAAANAAGYKIFIQVPKAATASVFITYTNPATGAAGNIEIAPGASYSTNDNELETQAITAYSSVSQSITVITK